MAYQKVDKLAVDDYMLDLSDYIKKSDVINMIAPVGHTMIRLDNTNPGSLPGYEGTTWQKISEGRMLVGANSAYPLGSNGGSADAVVVSHTHIQNPHNHSQNAHTHVQNSHNHTQEEHTHNAAADPEYRYLNFYNGGEGINHDIGQDVPSGDNTWKYPRVSNSVGNFGSQRTTHRKAAVNNPATATNQNTTATNNSATATNQNAGVDGRGKNMPPYLAVNIWVRTA